MKRTFDVMAASLLLFLTSPFILLAMGLVRVTSRGPAIYTQARVGLGGREFTIFKIRTMLDKCELLSGPKWCVPGDPRITTIGRVLRKLHVDELPQLWNVLCGDMSLIGPRPERPEFVTRLIGEVPGYRERHVVLPGITGLAQIQLSADTDFANVARKLRFDMYYIRHAGFRLDLQILVGTIYKLLGVPLPVLRRWLGIADTVLAPTIRTPFVPPQRAAAA